MTLSFVITWCSLLCIRTNLWDYVGEDYFRTEWVLSQRLWEAHMTSVCFFLLMTKIVVFLTDLNSQEWKKIWVLSKQLNLLWILLHKCVIDYHQAELWRLTILKIQKREVVYFSYLVLKMYACESQQALCEDYSI